MATKSNSPLIVVRWAAHTSQFLTLALGTYLVVGPHSMVAAGLLLGFGTGFALSGSV